MKPETTTATQRKENMHRSPFILTLVCFSDIVGTLITFGDQYSLECLSNYLSTITCSLNISDESRVKESSYWLHFSTYDEHHNCTLRMEEHSLLCELNFSPDETFTDIDRYTISLHSRYHGNNFSVVLDDDFMPCKHIRPIPPSDLSVLWEKDRALFQWQSGYDKDNFLRSSLQYQLSVYSQHKSYEVEAADQKVYVDETRFEPRTNYTVRVRSRPDQVDYKGVWSLWAPALHWRSRDIQTHNETPEASSQTGSTWFFLLLLLPLVLLSCIPYNRWRKDEYIPSPAPYFKDWDVNSQMLLSQSGKVCDVMQGEESLQIDILIESAAPPPHQTAFDYERMGVSDEQGSPMVPQSPVGSEVDSGCWIHDFLATERGSITCSEDYCTLSNSHTYAI